MTEDYLQFINVVLVYPWLTQITESRFLSWLVPKETDERGMGKIMGYVFFISHQKVPPWSWRLAG